jgi:Symplekin tight junction protein C terminal
MLAPQVWNDNAQWKGWLLAAEQAGPPAFPVLLALPPSVLARALGAMRQGATLRPKVFPAADDMKCPSSYFCCMCNLSLRNMVSPFCDRLWNPPNGPCTSRCEGHHTPLLSPDPVYCLLEDGTVIAFNPPLSLYRTFARSWEEPQQQTNTTRSLDAVCCVQLAAFAAAPDCRVAVSLDTLRVLQGEVDD